jgi:hypothetical protein
MSRAVARCHAVTEASAIRRLHVCADKEAGRIGLEAVPEAMALGFICAQEVREVRLEVHRATGGGVDEVVDTLVFPVGTYEGAVAAHEFREAFLRHKHLPRRQTT